MMRTVKIPTFSMLLLTVLEYLWAVIVILNGNSVYNADAYHDYHLLELCVVLTVVLLAVESYVNGLRLTKGSMMFAIGMMLYFVVYLCFRQGSMSAADFSLLFLMGLPFLYVLFTCLHRQGMLLPLFCKLGDVVCILAVISLYYWIFGVVLKQIKPNSTIYINWGVLNRIRGFDGLHFVYQLDTTFFPEAFIYRNSGIFTEAPMLNLWLDIAMAIELFIRKRSSKLRMVILVVTTVTTMSLTGLLFLALCLVLHVIRDLGAMGGLKKGLLFLVALVCVPVLAAVIGYSLILKSDTLSYLMRLSDYVAGVRLWLDHPLLGAGYSNLQPLMKYVYSPSGAVGFSNSLTAVLGTGGLWMALAFYIPHFGMLVSRWTGDEDISRFGVCYLYLFCTTVLFSRYIAVVMIAFALAILTGSRNKEA